MTLELSTTDGVTAGLPLSRFRLLPPPLPSRFTRWSMLDEDRYPETEVIFQDFDIPLSTFARTYPDFAPSRLSSVPFVFDREPGEGLMVLDDLGFELEPVMSSRSE